MNGPEWCTIESDPGVFTELISKFGVKGVQVEELWGLEASDFARLSPMYGLIFLFKWDSSLQSDISVNVLDEVPEGVFFAKQTINNACATQSILSILLNCSDKIDLGSKLNSFLDFSKSLDPESIGISLAAQDDIRIAHNSFSRPEPIEIEKTKDDEEGEAFHFISYVPVNGILYEIDGLQKGPRLIDGCDDNDWFEKAKNVLQQRMASYQSKELRFTLLAICKDLKEKYKEERKESNDKERINQLDELIKNEEIKQEKWKNENIRRRHNYFPFILNLIRILGKNNVLKELTERAKEKKKEKLKRIEEEKKKREENEKKEKEKQDKEKDNDTEMLDKSDINDPE